MIYTILLFLLPKSLFIRWFHERIHHIKVFNHGHQFKVRVLYDGVFHYTQAKGVIDDLNKGVSPKDYRIERCMTLSCFAATRYVRYMPIADQVKGMVEYDKHFGIRATSIKIVLI